MSRIATKSELQRSLQASQYWCAQGTQGMAADLREDRNPKHVLPTSIFTSVNAEGGS